VNDRFAVFDIRECAIHGRVKGRNAFSYARNSLICFARYLGYLSGDILCGGFFGFSGHAISLAG
jgi:hypothetical protein